VVPPDFKSGVLVVEIGWWVRFPCARQLLQGFSPNNWAHKACINPTVTSNLDASALIIQEKAEAFR
jgi:hypothetical protein